MTHYERMLIICAKGRKQMPRPKCMRHIRGMPERNYFKPRGIPVSELEEITLHLDEFEAIRLADFEGLYHQEAAARMKISRQTFGRIVVSARRKIADALIYGKALRIEEEGKTRSLPGKYND